jgi:predicted kinase
MDVNSRNEEEKLKDFVYSAREKRIFMTVGLPLSGKSTLRRRVMASNPGITLICADQLRFQIYNNRFYSKGENLVWAIREHMLESLMMNANYIFIDETNTTIKRRTKIIKLAKSYNYKVYALCLDTTEEECIIRAKKCDDECIIPVIKNMSAQFEKVTISEGFEQIITIQTNKNDTYCDWNIFKFTK